MRTSRQAGVGRVGGGAGCVQKLSRQECRASQSVKSQQGALGSRLSSGDYRVIIMGTWSEPVEGRVEASHGEKAGDICGLEKAKSITPGLWDSRRGKRG